MKETLLNLKAIVPLILLVGDSSDEQTEAEIDTELTDRAIAELLEMSNYLNLDISESFGKAPQIEIKEISPSEIDDDPNSPYRQMIQSKILQFSIKLKYDPAEIEGQFDEESISVLGRAGVIGLANDILANELRKKIMNIFLAANIAKPGAIGFESGMIYTNGQSNTELGYFNCDYLGQEDYQLDSIIRLRELPIRKVWDWLDSIEGISFQTAVGSVGRAIGALSYTFGPESSHFWSQIIWALLGLEAIYAPKEQLQKYQMTANIPNLIGKKAVNEDLIERLYTLRLQFMHGGADFPFSYSEQSELSGLDEGNEEYFEAQHYALALLIASLQELSERGQTESPFLESD
jgi:hypothetical protein